MNNLTELRAGLFHPPAAPPALGKKAAVDTVSTVLKRTVKAAAPPSLH